MIDPATGTTGVAGRPAILTRRLLPLVVTQACGAFNDNLVKNALVVLALFRLGEGGIGFSALAGALLIAPYILLSATAGSLADRMPKRALIVRLKVFEIGLMLLAGLGFLTGSVTLLLGVILGLGIQSALFGPVKYAILPEHLRQDELIAGNGAIEAATFVAIVIGTVAGGAFILLPTGATLVASLGGAAAAAGLVAALALPPTTAVAPGTPVEANLARAAWSCVRGAFASRPIRLSIFGLSGFWTVGATIITALPVVARDTLGGTGGVLTLFLVIFAAGVGVGSLLCSRLLRGEVSPRYVPFAAAGLGLLTGAFALVAAALGPAAAGGPMDLFRSAGGIVLLLSLFGLAACGGIFSVPLYAIIQETSDPARRASTIAANNIVNAVAMVAGAGVAAALAALGLSVTDVLLVTAALTLLGAGYIVRILPRDVLRTLFRAYFDTFHGVDLRGLENYRAAGDRLVIVSNHLSFADACLIACYLPRSPTFAVNTAIAERWWTRPFLAAVDIFKVDIASPFAIKRMVEAVRDDGRQLMIFPEGRLTKTGALMKVYEGAGVVADKAGAKVLPISIQGLQFTRLSRLKGRLPMRWFPRLSITILPAADLRPEGAAEMTPRKRREAVGLALGDLMTDAVFLSKPTNRTIFGALLDARDLHGGRTLIAEDIARQPISYDRIVTGALALGRKIATLDDAVRRANPRPMPAITGEERALSGAVGLMLPNANAALVTFMALQAVRRVPAMLNFSAGADAMLSACRGADLATVVSSRAFVEKAKLGKVVERMAPHVSFLWLEDLRASLTWRDKLRARAGSLFARRLADRGADPDAPALILFTSGSEGAPKGVVHSSRTLLANIAQISTVVDFTASDRVFSALPMFHSFGMTGGTLLPILHGVRTFFYPSPLHYRIVPALIYDTDATVAFGTDTFLNGWARFAHPYDFYAIRYVFAGAERVRPETKQLYAERFGVRVLEGYGATETAPALALNTAMHTRPGTVGRFLPGIETRLDHVPGIAEGGQLLVRGPNVMLGYLKADRPGIIQPPAGGWYDTGDIVAVSPDRYGRIIGRVKRWANIAGEKVSLVAAEELAAALWPDASHAVVKIPDPRKGEAMVLATTRADATAEALLAFARGRAVAEIAVPRLVVPVGALPLLGTGKTDLPGVQALVEAALLARPAA
ncbi:acyl-[ACP]--phospholipid O-acyltransferase [Roseomonas sp. KE2513]|uniref:acyl-[ACP]--phospholipid O-acyltransferase n=1 Tax=Roseomonas sp. KE2513 TaxID=2479202 RepID=UPI0018DF7D32|nr:acyl-[ACP]--phospholipid O-acyltransferase [Roseomonas sp. KE2513]MBI0539529.1 acyl-[ACP]--phospholipid O-acyltransferase [Roseomonas sp. KE2513]